MAEEVVVTDAQALSVLNALDQEAGLWIAQRRGLQRVREVIQAFAVARKGLEDLEDRKAALEDEITRIKPRLVIMKQEAENEMGELRQAATTVRTNADAQIEASRGEAERAQFLAGAEKDRLAEFERATVRRLAELDEEVGLRQSTLDAINRSITEAAENIKRLAV